MSIAGSVLWRGEEGYEQARTDAVWNARKPGRYPAVIVQAVSEDDVVAAVRLARERGLKVKARSGGHSWTASSVMDGGMLIDLSRLTDVSLDPETRTAVVSPGTRGRDLNRLLAEHGLFFPSGHCPTVGVGGFLLQGGWGWNSRVVGPACLSVEGVDVVLAGGVRVHAAEGANRDVLWAARGAGPGFFGMVTRFHLRVHPRPASIMSSGYVYPLALVDEVLRWAMEVAPKLPPALELVILGTTPRLADGTVVDGDTALIVSGAALMPSDQESVEALKLLETCPVLDRAVSSETFVPRTFDELYAGAESVEPEGFRWAVDNMWTDAGPDELVPAVRELFTSVPSAASHVFWYPWHEQPFPDAALSVQGKLYIAAFAGWTDAREDARFEGWCAGHMRRLEPLSKGIQLADENLVARPARFLSDENLARLAQLRAEHDPEGLFQGYLVAD